MHRIDTADNVGNLFSDGDPAAGIPGTIVDDEWFNAVQEEIAGVIEAAGIVLDKATRTQLRAALDARQAAMEAYADQLQFAKPVISTVAAGLFLAGWAPSGTGVRYWKDRFGVVHMTGTVQYSGGGTWQIFTPPAAAVPDASTPAVAGRDTASGAVVWVFAQNNAIGIRGNPAAGQTIEFAIQYLAA